MSYTGFTNAYNRAWVNMSSSQIPVYANGNTASQIHIGGVTAGGAQIGTIWPHECYTARASGSNVTVTEIRFRNSNGALATGYIEPSQGYTLDDYAWAKDQELYHYLKSNGTSLSLRTSGDVTINGTSYYKFDVTAALQYVDTNNANGGMTANGWQLATNTSQVGQANPQRMKFFYYRTSSSGTWTRFYGSTNDKYAFVNLGFHIGSMPANRPIR